MKVFRADRDGTWHLIGRAEIADRGQPVHDEPLFGPLSSIVDRFAVGTVTTLPPGGLPVVERGILLAADQHPELLPGWQPLDG